MKSFKAGMAKADITPSLGALLYGYPSIRPAKKVLDNIFVKAVVLNQNGKTVVLISAEICSLNLINCQQIAEAISDSCGIEKENIIYSAIHTHSAPITTTVAGWGSADEEYINNILISQSVAATKSAIENMQDAVMAIETTESLVGINRREVTPDGKVILGQNPDGPYDPTMTAIQFKNLKGENIGTIIHFACHPTASGENLSVSRDWPGYMIDRVEEITNAPCMYINGAEGDIGPRLSNGKTTGDEALAKEVGLIAADDVKKAIENAKDFFVPELKTISGTLSLPLIEMPTLESIIDKMEAMGDPEKLIEVDITTYARLEKLKKMHEDKVEPLKTVEIHQTVVALSNLALAPFPFEAFHNLAKSLAEKSPFEKTLWIGLAGGSFGYIPTEEQLPYGGYEVDSFRAATIPGFVDGTDKNVVSESIKLLNKLYTI